MLFEMTSDKEYIEKLIRSYERRKKRAAFFGVVSVIFGVLAYLSYVALDEKTHELTSSISSTLTEGRELTESDIELVEVNNELYTLWGFVLGSY